MFMPQKIPRKKSIITAKKDRERASEYYYRYKRKPNPLKEYIQYKCPCCGYYVNSLDKFEDKGLETTKKTFGGEKRITAERINPPLEYKKRIKEVCEEILQSL